MFAFVFVAAVNCDKHRTVTGVVKFALAVFDEELGRRLDELRLDEPTNILDIDGIRWLEKFLSSYEGVLVTISHDRHFLNEICTHIADIDYETIITYTGGYDDMVVAKSQVRGKIEQENAERKKIGRASCRE